MSGNRKRHDKLKDGAEEPDWDGVEFKSVGVGGKSWFTFDGYRYCTPGEMILARLLEERGVPFTPDVRFVMKNDDSASARDKVIYVPDFIFNGRAWVWTEDDGIGFVIHGLEVKAHKPRSGSKTGGLPAARRMLKKQALLFKRRRIAVIIVSEAEVEAWNAEGGLPIRPFDSGS